MASNIALCGSADVIAEFFEYCINSILFHRGIYEPENFKMVKKYNINLLVTTDEKVQKYLNDIMSQIKIWLRTQKIKKLVVALLTKEKKDVMERWEFNINVQSRYNREKDDYQIQNEMQIILRQLTASIDYLPVLEVPCTFNVLAYMDKNAEIPKSWVNTDPKLIKYNQQHVTLRNVSTPYHSVNAMVSYRFRDY
ncbi:mitotic spindle checkpoint component mad2 [Neocallimastix lanati (nom. inval.)]|jgi:mitotic spindle assembly checkpoint protein MAD2|uniref:Mitotic spindle checkpoint component mad2 n=1 Tax=Neocallimastix californiae TaxID=1754190 RepID=A0A1Y2ET31_9FUNG|nr:mitotic spindle checkpoint component mad2 [Neocallimastix sp. JGI-2020a]ORY74728.1 mitotic spindle checkpoint component mad2 [Neocallimastix californiae]|eukprot:ORY74728.1 mitotic spindle checkpoint component mad2 [Neocallimastix californiae]